MPTDVAELFDDWAARLARGETPDPLAYLDRAGEARDDLARLMDAYLQSVPRREPDPETVELARAWVAGASPLAELRVRRGLRRGELVDAIVAEFGLAPEKHEIVRRYYHRLEAGLSDPAALSARLLGFLAAKLDVAQETILAWRARPLGAAPAFRGTTAALIPESPGPKGDLDDPEVWDLFLSGRGR